tara:strand:- start:3099 stop:3560 length:462 start_codon:yes stop_codon:yes gene_type:complete
MEEKIQLSQEFLMKAVLANTTSATKISKILCDHSEDNILKADEIILGLIYRLMTPMTDEEMTQSINEAESVLYAESSDDESEEENIIDDTDVIDNTDDLSVTRKIKCNTCNCEICMRCRICLSNFNDYIPKDNLGDLFKNSILETCKTHNRIL